MNKQRKVLITITYNEMGIIIDTKAEEVAQPVAKDINVPTNDCISRQDAIDAIDRTDWYHINNKGELVHGANSKDDVPLYKAEDIYKAVNGLPSAQPESCEYYALCRHGRDENKLRARLKFCEYCNEDSDGYVKPIEKNNHAFVRFGMNGWELDLKTNGWHGSAKIRYCPMCGRKLQRT